MTERQLEELYTKYHRAKSNEWQSLLNDKFPNAKDLGTVSDVEFSVLIIATCGYFQSKFIVDLLKMTEFNDKLGLGYKSIIESVFHLQERHQEERKAFEKKNPDKPLGLIMRNKRLWGIFPIPFTRTFETAGEVNEYTFQSSLESAKTEQDIIQHYAELKATLYYYKRGLIKNKLLKGQFYNALVEGKIDTNKLKDIMIDVITEFQNQAPEIVGFLGKGLASGLFSGIGKDFWEKIKDRFKSDKEKEIVGKFEENPEDIRLQGKLEGLLENKMAEMSQQELLDLFQLFQKTKADNPTIQTISNSKNVLNNSTIFVGGDFHLGDKTNQ
jgi:hypothetical protein